MRPRISFRSFLIASLLLTARAVPAASFPAQLVTSQTMLPLNTTVSVNTPAIQDLVTLSGSLHLVSQLIPTDPCQPGDPCRITTTLVNVTGTGQITGLRYQATGTSIFESTTPPDPIAPTAIAFTGSYRMTPNPPPITPPDPILPQISFVLPLSISISPNGQILSAGVQSGGVLWMGNDSTNPADLATATTTTGAGLETVAGAVSGVAFDGANLWFSDPFGNLTKRTSDGNTVLASFPGGVVASTEDMAWDTKRQRLWRTVNYAPALQRIDPATGTIEATYPLPVGSLADPLYPRAAIGLAYDPTRDRLYVSYCKVGCSTFGGAVGAVDPATGASLGDLFNIPSYLLGGLAFDPVSGTLWVALWDGIEPVLTNMTLTGSPISSFARPGAFFVDGFEFIGSASIP